MAGEVTVVARHDIDAGGEITGDYALWEAEDSYLVESCTCRAETCRGVIRGTDWQLPELQECYSGHFLPYIERRFRQSV